MSRRSKSYGADLASIHDAGFGDVARAAARTLSAVLRRRSVPRGLVVELGCGSGLLAAALSRTGRPFLGVDLSPSMISIAKRRAPRARFRVGSLHRVEIPRCAAVVSSGECFSYVFDGAPDLERLFRRVFAALLPGGVFLFDVAAPGRVPGRGPLRLHREGDGWAILVALTTDARRRILTRRMTSFRKVGAAYRRSTEVHRQRLFRAAEVEGALRRAGFESRALEGYVGRPLSPGQIGYLARKPAERASATRASSRPSTPRTSKGCRRGARPR